LLARPELVGVPPANDPRSRGRQAVIGSDREEDQGADQPRQEPEDHTEQEQPGLAKYAVNSLHPVCLSRSWEGSFTRKDDEVGADGAAAGTRRSTEPAGEADQHSSRTGEHQDATESGGRSGPGTQVPCHVPSDCPRSLCATRGTADTAAGRTRVDAGAAVTTQQLHSAGKSRTAPGVFAEHQAVSLTLRTARRALGDSGAVLTFVFPEAVGSPMAVHRVRFEDVLARLDAVTALSDDLGLADQVRRSRFASYRRTVSAAIDRVRADQPGRSGLEALEDAVALIESLLLGEAVPFLRTCPADIVAPRLKVVLDGPALPNDESPKSNQARNVMFEFTMGFRLWRAGLSPQLGEHPDLTCTVDGTQVLMECKRPLSGKKVLPRIKEAKDRVLADIKRAPAGTRGAIAISFTKVLGRDDCFLEYSDEARVRAWLDAELEHLAEPTRKHWTQLPDKIIAMVFHLMVIAVHTSGRFDRAEQLLGYTVPANRPTHPLALTLGERLRRTAY